MSQASVVPEPLFYYSFVNEERGKRGIVLHCSRSGRLCCRSSPDNLVKRANDIGKFFASQASDQAVAGVADRLQNIGIGVTIVDDLNDGWHGREPLAAECLTAGHLEAERRLDAPNKGRIGERSQ